MRMASWLSASGRDSRLTWRACFQVTSSTRINQKRVTSLDVIKAAHTAYGVKPEPTLFEAERDRRVSLNIVKP